MHTNGRIVFKKMNKTNKLSLLLLTLISSVLFSTFLLSSVSAEESHVDNVDITVPVACTLSGVGMNSHTATINPGTYNSAIGTTTFNVLCNDSEGFAIYAIGYTNDTDGNNTLTSTTLSTPVTINTGTALSGNSQWAMKLATISSPTPTYPITIQNSFDSFHTVPDDYTLVAKRTASTDVGPNAEGSSFTSTYQAYISSTQAADTYVGKVKYVMVHPSAGDPPIRPDQIAVVFEGDLENGVKRNRMVYGNVCSNAYISSTPYYIYTSNLDYEGNQDGPYADDEFIRADLEIPDTVKAKIEIDYGLTAGTGYIEVDDTNGDLYYEVYSDDENLAGSLSFILDSNENDPVRIIMETWDSPVAGYDYGMYAKVYPIYSSQKEGTVETDEATICSYAPVSGTYIDSAAGNGWYKTYNGRVVRYDDDEMIAEYINNSLLWVGDDILGTTITLRSYDPYTIIYDGNGATAGTMNGFVTEVAENTGDVSAILIAPNYYKSGYGFAGWSENPNATVSSGDRIFGPNETITGSDVTFDSNKEATLYAVWVPSSGTMQNWSGCNQLVLAPSGIIALTDSRDGNVYTVGLMQDGYCWMMENLRLDASNSSDSSKAQGFGGVFVGLANSEQSSAFSYGATTSNSLYSTSNITGSNQGSRFPRYNDNNSRINDSSLTTTPYGEYDPDNIKWYGYGNYYSWAAAMANTSDLTTASSSVTADTSICPKNWYLPLGGVSAGETSFSYLDVQMGGNGDTRDAYNDSSVITSERWRSFPNNFVFSGNMVGYRGESGSYWSTTINTSSTAYSLNISDAYINPGNYPYNNKNYGSAVRCLKYPDVIDN